MFQQASQDSPRIQGDGEDAKKLTAAFDKLQSAAVGQPIADVIRKRGTTVRFGALDNDAIAQFDPAANTITISASQKDAHPAVLAAHLAHEGTHAGWDKPYRADSFKNFAEAHVEEEYQAHKAQDEVWRALRGKEADEQCDRVSDLIKQGEYAAKTDILRRYSRKIQEAWQDITGA